MFSPLQTKAMLYLLNSLPNAILIPEAGEIREIKGISEAEAITLWQNTGNTLSAIGHESTADVLCKRGLECKLNRIQVSPKARDILLVAAFTPNRRLAEGEFFTEAEILRFPIKFCTVNF
jgi:hypothetical protein